ncbi:MAG: SGNH/GDSL hydrolase family protein [Erythrobacter sp.]|nr:SGNH/GDSL hydrolase family protein [Erythrobacter sp.]
MTARFPSLTSAKKIALAIVVLLLGLVAALWQELPQWRLGGTQSIPASSVAHLLGNLVCPASGSRIAIIGDSHVAGSRMGEDSAPFGVVLEQSLAGRVKVVRYGAGGETAIDGEKRWLELDLPEANLVVLVYGTNDAAPRGWLGDKTTVPVDDYKAALNRQVALWRNRGVQVVLLAPPPGGSTAITRRLSPYREAAGAVGRSEKVAVFDPADAFTSCPSAQPVLVGDALHMNAAGHECLGTWLAHQFCPAPG